MFTTSYFRRVSLLGLVAITLLLAGCMTGNSYPAERARTYCASLFACVDADQIELMTTYDDADECVQEETETYEGSSGYRSFLEGGCAFDSDSAQRCLEEASSVISDADCDGNMGFLSFLLDIADDDCDDVYCD